MRKGIILLVCFFWGFVHISKAQAPALPGDCKSNATGGNGGFLDWLAQLYSNSRNNMELNQGTNNTFTINLASLLESSSSETNSFSIDVRSQDSKYKISVAASLSYSNAATPTTNIPLNTFQISASRTAGNSPMPAMPTITLSGTYQPVITSTGPTTGNNAERFTFTINRGKLDTYMQSPGDYLLTLYVCYCWY